MRKDTEELIAAVGLYIKNHHKGGNLPEDHFNRGYFMGAMTHAYLKCTQRDINELETKAKENVEATSNVKLAVNEDR